MCSLEVPSWFSSGSQYVPQVSNVFPNMVSIAAHFYPICFGKCCPPFIDGPNGRNTILQTRKFRAGGASIVSNFFSDGPIKLARCPKKEIELGRQLI